MVLAIDAGFRCLGWALISPLQDKKKLLSILDCGTVETKTDPALSVAASDCNRAIYQGMQLHTLLMRIDLERGAMPAMFVIELPHGGAKSARAARTMGIATGIIGAICGATGTGALFVTPAQGKMAAAGARDASKLEVIRGVCSKTSGFSPEMYTKPRREAIADAIAAYLALEEAGWWGEDD